MNSCARPARRASLVNESEQLSMFWHVFVPYSLAEVLIIFSSRCSDVMVMCDPSPAPSS